MLSARGLEGPGRQVTRALALLGLALLGSCAPSRQLPTFQVDPSTRLGRLAIEAAQAWTDAGVPTRAGSAGDVPIFWVAPKDASCDDPKDDGCAFRDRIELVANEHEADDAHLLVLLLHEMGHVLRDQPGHLCRPDGVMSRPTRMLRSPIPADASFVYGDGSDLTSTPENC